MKKKTVDLLKKCYSSIDNDNNNDKSLRTIK